MDWNAQTRIVAVEGIVACDIADGSALLNLATSRYYKLNDTAALLWQELERRDDRSSTLGHLITVMNTHFEVDEATCRSDLLHLFEGLSQAGIVEIDDPQLGAMSSL